VTDKTESDSKDNTKPNKEKGKMNLIQRYRANAEAYLDRLYGKDNPEPSERPAVVALMSWLVSQADDAPELRETLSKHDGIHLSVDEVRDLLESYVSIFKVTHNENGTFWQLKNEAASVTSGADALIRKMGIEPGYSD
jgi:hypothetical protein